MTTTIHEINFYIIDSKGGMALQFIEDQDEYICKKAVRQNGLALQFVKKQTEEICLLAVRQNGLALQYVENKTEGIYLLAIQQNGLALQYVENQTEELCLLAVQQNGLALQYVENQTEELCLLAVSRDGLALQYVKEQTEEICKQAVKQNAFALNYVENQTEEICKESLCSNRKIAVKFIKNMNNNLEHLYNILENSKGILPKIDYYTSDEKYCKEAVMKDGMELQYIFKQTEEICLEAVKQNGLALQYVFPKFRTLCICLEAIKQNPLALQYVENQTEELCLEVVKQNGLLLQNIENQTEEICLEAIKQNPLALQYVENKTKEICNFLFNREKEKKYKSKRKDIFKFIPDEFKTTQMCIDAITIFSSTNYKYIPKELKNEEMAQILFKEDCYNISKIDDEFITYDMCLDVLKRQHITYFKYFPTRYYSYSNHELENICIKYFKEILQKNNNYINTMGRRINSFQKSEIILKFLLEQNPISIRFINKEYQTEEICELVIKLNIHTIYYISKYNKNIFDIILSAIKNDELKDDEYYVYKHIASLDIPDDIAVLILNKYPKLIKYMKQTESLYITALENNCEISDYIDSDNITDKVYEIIIKQHINVILKDLDKSRKENILRSLIKDLE